MHSLKFFFLRLALNLTPLLAGYIWTTIAHAQATNTTFPPDQWRIAFAWPEVTAFQDGKPLPGRATYNLHWGTESGKWSNHMFCSTNTTNVLYLSRAVTNLFVVATAVYDGVESDVSPEVNYAISARRKPAAPARPVVINW